MQKRFVISFTCSSKENRPPLSYKVREYLSNLVENEIIEKKIIVLKEGWQLNLAISFLEEGPRFNTLDILLANGHQTVKQERVKIYNMIVPLKLIQVSGNGFDAIVMILQKALEIFFSEVSKKVTPLVFENCWSKIDWDYLKSLPYPAPVSEQKYVGDVLRKDGTVEVFQI